MTTLKTVITLENNQFMKKENEPSKEVASLLELTIAYCYINNINGNIPEEIEIIDTNVCKRCKKAMQCKQYLYTTEVTYESRRLCKIVSIKNL